MNFKWKIISLKYKVNESGLSNIVEHLDLIYECTQKINEVDYSAQVGTYISLPSPDENSFVPFDQVTYETVCEWIETSFGEGEMANLRTKLEKIIQEQSAPTIVEIVNPFG